MSLWHCWLPCRRAWPNRHRPAHTCGKRSIYSERRPPPVRPEQVWFSLSLFLTYTVHRHSSAPHTVTATTARPHGLTATRQQLSFFLSFSSLFWSSFFFLLLLSSSVDWFDSSSAFLSLSIFCSLQLPICLFLSLYLFYCFSSQYTVHNTLRSAHINHKWAICLSLLLYLFYCFSTQHISITYSLDLFNYFSLLVNT